MKVQLVHSKIWSFLDQVWRPILAAELGKNWRVLRVWNTEIENEFQEM